MQESTSTGLEVKHTPGSWIVLRDCIWTESGVATKDVCIALINRSGAMETSANTRLANALLIAASPELLKACKLALQNLDTIAATDGFWSLGLLRDNLRAEIAKAEGGAA